MPSKEQPKIKKQAPPARRTVTQTFTARRDTRSSQRRIYTPWNQRGSALHGMLIQNSRFVNTSRPIPGFFSVFHKNMPRFPHFFATLKFRFILSSPRPFSGPFLPQPEAPQRLPESPKNGRKRPRDRPLTAVPVQCTINCWAPLKTTLLGFGRIFYPNNVF